MVAHHSDTCALQCMEIHGGTAATEHAVTTPGLDVWVYSRPYESDDVRLATTADQQPWPGVEDYRQGDLRLPSWMTLELRPDGSDAPVHWTRVALPSPPVPYELPVE